MLSLVQRHRPTLVLIGTVAAIVAVVFAVRGWMHRADAASGPARPNTVPVVTARVMQEDVPISLRGVGTVQAAQSVTVKARVDGQLDTVAFKEGQDVKQGDLLAQIDPRPYRALLDQALAQQARDQATLANALKDLDRYTTLVAQDSIQQQTLDTQRATVGQLQSALQADQAQIDSARLQLGFTTIRAPIAGRTGMRLVDAGNIVHAADANGLVVINQIDPIAVTFTLPEEALPRVTQGMADNGRQPLQVQAYAQAAAPASSSTLLGTGRLALVNNQIDTSTGTVQLKAVFDNPKRALWPGQYVDVRLVLGTRRKAATVPESAVQRGPDGLLAYVVKDDDTVAAQPVRVAQSQDGKAIIDDGLAVGTRVVVDGQYKIKPGVKIVEAESATRSQEVVGKGDAR